MDEEMMDKAAFGRAALAKFGAVPEGFHVYEAAWIGKAPKDWTHMRVSGAVFRRAAKGRHAGRLAIRVPGTTMTTIVTKGEIAAQDVTP